MGVETIGSFSARTPIIAQDRFVGAVLSTRFFPVSFLGVLANDIVIWFWIGSHDNYERLIKELR